MRAFTAPRGVVFAVCLAAAVLLLTASGALASGADLCLPAKEGKPVVTPIKGVCPKHYTLTELGKEGPAGKEGSAGKEGPAGKEGKPGPSPLSEEELKALKAILPYVKFSAAAIGGKPTIQISGANLQIVNGLGATKTLNGAGNLVIGYDETPECEEEECYPPPHQTGSHNLILGQEQTFTSYGAILGGFGNSASGPNSFVVGRDNSASGKHASVSGGQENTASGPADSVSGGLRNTAKGGEGYGGEKGASVSGGEGNVAFGSDSVSGGSGNTAQGASASVSGGNGNQTEYFYSSVSGGENNRASGPWASISGGENNLAGGESLEGYFPAPAWIGGGSGNRASGADSSVSGGEDNEARTPFTSVSGGSHNVAGGASGPGGCCESGGGFHAASVSGGYKNTARAAYSAILGGKEGLVETEYGHSP